MKVLILLVCVAFGTSVANGGLFSTVVTRKHPCVLESWEGSAVLGHGSRRDRLALRLRGGDGGELSPELTERLQALIKSAPVMLFMKGSPQAPQCGFSSKIIGILENNKIEFSSFNILDDQDVRQGLKVYSNWPTFPQLYANGKLIGGLDVVKELDEEGELVSELGVGTSEGGGSDGKVSEKGLEQKIKSALGAEKVVVEDLSDGCGAKFSALVVASKFEGMPLIERQRLVHEAIKEEMKTIHALTMKCKTPEQAKAMAE